MRIGILGTGVVGKTLGRKLAKLGNDVRLGSRTGGGEKARAWVKEAGGKSSEGTLRRRRSRRGRVQLHLRNGIARSA